MELIKVDLVFLLLSYSLSCIICFPSRPLNERSTELAWEAWLLVDDQNQNKNNPDTPTRSRITPKSVFIAPTFKPGSFPSCAEGYKPDKSGTCMQIIKIDENAHLEFLLQKLNEKFGDFEYDLDPGSPEDTPTQGPFQVNIPLGGGGEDDDDNSPDIAIVVAPTNGNSEESDGGKVKRTDVKNDTVETEESSTESSTTTVNGENTTLFDVIEGIANEETTTSQEETTTEAQQALFYLQDQTAEDQTARNEESTNETPNQQQEVVDKAPKPLGEIIFANSQSNTANYEMVNQPPASSIIKFPDEPANVQRKKPPTVEEIEALIRDIIHNKGSDSSNERHAFRHRDPPITETAHHSSLALDPDIRHKLHANHDRYSSDAHGNDDVVYNHRNRDKWNFQQPSYREPNPIVLKFANRSQNGRQAYPESHHQRHHSEGVYRKVPDDLSYLFGLKARPHISHS